MVMYVFVCTHIMEHAPIWPGEGERTKRPHKRKEGMGTCTDMCISGEWKHTRAMKHFRVSKVSINV